MAHFIITQGYRSSTATGGRFDFSQAANSGLLYLAGF